MASGFAAEAASLRSALTREEDFWVCAFWPYASYGHPVFG
jgi:hypothetical protein